MRKKLIIISVAILVVVFVIIEGNFLGERIPENRHIAMNMLSCTLPSDTYIIETISDLSPECRNVIDRLERPSDKKIIAYNKQWNITLNFDLIESGNQKIWKCRGRPLKFFPKQCR